MTDRELSDVLALLEKATPGNWYYVQGHGWCCKSDTVPYAVPVIRDASTYDGPPSDDERAIRFAVNFLRKHGPALLAALSTPSSEGDGRDGERYRWLRDQNANIDNPDAWTITRCDFTDAEGPNRYWVGCDIDTAIDAAIAAAAGGGDD